MLNPFQLMVLSCLLGILVWMVLQLILQTPPEWVVVEDDHCYTKSYGYNYYVEIWRPARIEEAQDLFINGKIEEAKEIIRWINNIDRVNRLEFLETARMV